MRNSGIIILVLLFLLSSDLVSGQKLRSGNLMVLRGQTLLNLQYDYSGMAVGKFSNENDYVADRTADLNKSKPGSGDIWASKWVSNRASTFQPKFEQELNARINEFRIMAKEGQDDAKYTLIIHTTFTEPGFNAFVKKRAEINLTVTLVETSAKDRSLAVIDMPEMKNEQEAFHYGEQYDTGLRISTCYERAGEKLGKFLAKTAFK